MKLRSRRKSGVNERPADTPSEAGVTVSAKPDAVERHGMVATAAYYLAERRGFEPGHELEDWLAAEAEVESLSRLVSLHCAQSFWSES